MYRLKSENRKEGVIYTRETPFIEYLKDLRRINICQKAMDYYENVNQENPEITFGEVIDKYPPRQGWAKSMLVIYGNQLDEGVRKSMMGYVKDEVMNYLLWKKLTDITDEEREILRNKFKGKLPNIERGL